VTLTPEETGGSTLALDVCRPCMAIWLDPGEAWQLPREVRRGVRREDSEDDLSP